MLQTPQTQLPKLPPNYSTPSDQFNTVRKLSVSVSTQCILLNLIGHTISSSYSSNIHVILV